MSETSVGLLIFLILVWDSTPDFNLLYISALFTWEWFVELPKLSFFPTKYIILILPLNFLWKFFLLLSNSKSRLHVYYWIDSVEMIAVKEHIGLVPACKLFSASIKNCVIKIYLTLSSQVNSWIWSLPQLRKQRFDLRHQGIYTQIIILYGLGNGQKFNPK